MQHYVTDPVKTRSLSKRLGLCDDSAQVVKTITAQPEIMEMETNREATATSTPSHLEETKHHPPSNISLLAEMDLSLSDDDESFEASVTTQEVPNFDVELPREDSESPEAREGSISVSPRDTDWSEHGPKKRRRTENRVGKMKPCDICGKLLTANHMRRHQRAVHGKNNTNPPSQPVINSFATSQLLSMELKVDLEMINLKSWRITPDDPCKGRRKITLDKEEPGIYRIQGQPTSKNKRQQICPFCGKISTDWYNLVRHCSAQHFRGHLLQYVRKGSCDCPFCGISHRHQTNLLGHIGGKHKRDEVESLIRGDTDRDENKNDKNSNLSKYERSHSSNEPVETVALPEPHPSTLKPDDDYQIDFDLKNEMIESVPSDSNSGKVQEENTEINLRRILDSNTESDSE